MGPFNSFNVNTDVAKVAFYQNLDSKNLPVVIQRIIETEEKPDTNRDKEKLLRQKYELEVSDIDIQDSPCDSFFTAILQNVLDNYRLHKLDDVLSECKYKGKGFPLELNRIKQMNEELTVNDISLIFFNSNGSAISPVRNTINSLLSYIIEEFDVRLDLYLFDIQTWSLQKFNSSLNGDNEKEVRPVIAVLVFDHEKNVFRSVFFRKKMFKSYEDYCEEIMNNFVEEQEMLPYFGQKFDSLESSKSQDWTEKEIEKLENLKSISVFYKEMLPGYDTAVTNSNLLLLQKYEKELPEIVAEELLRKIKWHYNQSLSTASKYSTECKIAKEREKVNALIEKEEQLKLEDDRLHQIVDNAERDNQQVEDNLRKLNNEMKNGNDNKDQLERQIAEEKAKLAKTQNEINLRKENFAWNTLKMELMGITVSYKNLKRGSELRAFSAGTLDEIFTAIYNVFPLNCFQNEDVRNSLQRFSKKSENNTQANRNAILELLCLITEEPKFRLVYDNQGTRNNPRKILEVTGRQIILSQVLKNSKLFSFSEIRIVAGSVLYMDEDMNQADFHGKNVVCTSHIIDVVKDVTINTSGYDGNPNYTGRHSKAADGCYPGRDGDNGGNGGAGESAGNVFLNATEWRNSQRLKVIANGGNGGHGQDGGDGRDGAYGYDGIDAELGHYSYFSTYYDTFRGTSGCGGQRGGNGGNAGLGGGPGWAGRVQIVGNHSCSDKKKHGDYGDNGSPGKGGRGGIGGREGVDQGVAWYNYGFAGGEWRFGRGKLSFSKQNRWYGGGGYTINVCRTESEVKSSQGKEATTGKDGEHASSQCSQRNTSAESQRISESEISLVTSSVRNQYRQGDVTNNYNDFRDEENNMNTLRQEIAQAEQSKAEHEQQNRATEAAIENSEAEKARLEQVIAQSSHQREEVQRAMENVSAEKAVAEQTVKNAETAHQADLNVQQVIQNHLRQQNQNRIAENAQLAQRATTTKEFVDSKRKNEENTSPVDDTEKEEDVKTVKSPFDKIPTVAEIEKMPDDLFAIAIASRVKNRILADSFKIGLHTFKSLADGNKMSESVRKFLLSLSQRLVMPPKKSFLTSEYLKEKLPYDTEIVSHTQSWVDKNKPEARKMFQFLKYSGNSVGQFLIMLRQRESTPRVICIKALQSSIDVVRKKIQEDPVAVKFLGHLDSIVIDLWQFWFLEKCKQQIFSEYISKNIKTLVKTVSDIYLDVKEFFPGLFLEHSYNTFLRHIKNAKNEKRDINDIWREYVLDITKLNPFGKMSVTKCLSFNFKILDLAISKHQENNPVDLDPNQEHIMNALHYVVPYLELSPEDLQKYKDRCDEISANLSGININVYAKMCAIKSSFEDNYNNNYQQQQKKNIDTLINKKWLGKQRNELLVELDQFISLMESPLSPCTFQQRIAAYTEIYQVLSSAHVDEITSKFISTLEKFEEKNIFPLHKIIIDKTFIGKLLPKNANLPVNLLRHVSLLLQSRRKRTEKTFIDEIFALNDAVIDYFKDYGNRTYNCRAAESLNTFQESLEESWYNVVKTKMNNLLVKRESFWKTRDEKIDEIIKFISDLSGNILLSQDIVNCTRMHLYKIVDAMETQTGNEDSLKCLERIYNVLTQKSKKVTPQGFIHEIASVLNAESSSQISFEINLTVKGLGDSISCYNKTPEDLKSFLLLLKNFFNFLNNEKEFSLILENLLNRLVFIASHIQKMNSNVLDISVTNVDAGEDKMTKEIRDTLEIIEKLIDRDYFPDSTLTTIHHLKKCLRAHIYQDFAAFWNVLHEERCKKEKSFEQKFGKCYEMSLAAISDISRIFFENQGDVFTFAGPIKHLVIQIFQEILPRIESLSSDSLNEHFDNIYLESLCRYFSSESIPLMPSSVAESICHLKQISNTDQLTSIFSVFDDFLTVQIASEKKAIKNHGWELPFLSIFSCLPRILPEKLTTCEELHLLGKRVSTLRKKFENGKSKFLNNLVSKLNDVERALVTSSRNHLVKIICDINQEFGDLILENITRQDQCAQIICSEGDASGLKLNLYKAAESFLKKSTTLSEKMIIEYKESVVYSIFDEYLQSKLGPNFSRLMSNAESSIIKLVNVDEKQKWSVVLGIIILTFNLNKLEMEFCDRIILEDEQISWTPSRKEQIFLKDLAKLDDTQIVGNRLAKLFIDNISVNNKDLILPFLSEKEQFYVSKAFQLMSTQEYEETTNYIKDVLANHSPADWLDSFRELVVNTLFRRLLSLYYTDADFEARLENPEEDKNNQRKHAILSIVEELKIFRESHQENDSNAERLQSWAERYHNEDPSCTSPLNNVIDNIINFKYVFNRHFFFALQRKVAIPDEQLIDWLDILYQRCSLHRLAFSEFNELLARSVDLTYEELIILSNESTLENGVLQSVLMKIVRNYYNQFIKKKTNASNINETYVEKLFENLAKYSSKMKNKLLGILGDKLMDEVQFASQSVSMDIKAFHSLLEEMSTLNITADLVNELDKHPLTRWSTKFREHKLLKFYDKITTDAILKFEDKIDDLTLSSTFLEIISKASTIQSLDADRYKAKLCFFINNFSRNHWDLDEILIKELTKIVDEFTKQEDVDLFKNLEDKCIQYSEELKKNSERKVKELIPLMRKLGSKNLNIKKYLELYPISKGKDAPLAEKCKLQIMVEEILTARGKKSHIVPNIDLTIENWEEPHIMQWAEYIIKGRHNARRLLEEKWAKDEDQNPSRQPQKKVTCWGKKERRELVEEHIDEVLAVVNQGLKIFKGYYARDTQNIAARLLIESSFKQKGCLAEVATGEGKTFIVAMMVIVRGICGDDVDVITSSPVLAKENLKEVVAFFKIFEFSAVTNCDNDCDENELKQRYKNNKIIYGDVGSFQRDILLTTFHQKGITMGRTADIVFVDEVDNMLLDKGETLLYLSHKYPELKPLWLIFVEIWQGVNAPDVYRGRTEDVLTVVQLIKEKIRRGDLIFPNCLQKFVRERLTIWVKNAFLAKTLDEDDAYILMKGKKGYSPCIMDNDIGVEQESMNWSNGLQQFILLKHSDNLTSETLKAVFMSNISYFRGFEGRLFGITGTLGSNAERQLLAQLYGVEFFAMPRFRRWRCYEEKGLVLGTTPKWLDKIMESVKEKCEKKRANLIIAKNVASANVIFEYLRKVYGDKVTVYKSSYDEEFKLRLEKEELKPGEIIVSTNIAGRGTDFKTSEELEEAGGLHVIMSFMPANKRIEDQAFGRTARGKNNGSCQYIILHEADDGSTVEQLQRLRDEVECRRLENFRLQSIPRIELEEKLCDKFKVLLNDVRDKLKPGMEKHLLELHLENLKNRWAMWLDSMSERIKAVYMTSEDPILEDFGNFKEEMITNCSRETKFETGPIEITKLGDYFEEKKNYSRAEFYFDKAIQKEPYFSETAHCYKAACVLRRNDTGISGKHEATKHLKVARTLLRKRVQLLLGSSKALEITENLRMESGHGTMANRYEKQVQRQIELFQVHIGKVEEAIGTVLDEKFFRGVRGILDESEGQEIFDVLRRHENILKNFRVSRKLNFDSKTGECYINKPAYGGHQDQIIWPSTYEYCKKEVLQFLNDKSKSNRTLEENAFENFILTKNKLWKMLKDSNFIHNEQYKEVLIICAEEIKVLDNISFPENLANLKTPLAKRLHTNHQTIYDREILHDAKKEDAVYDQIEDILVGASILKKTPIHSAFITESMKSRLKWNASHENWTGLPEELKRYSDVIETIIENERSSENEVPSVRDVLILNVIPLPETENEGSKIIWECLFSAGAIKNVGANFNVRCAESKAKIEERLSEIETALNSNSELKSILRKYHGDDEKQIVKNIMNAITNGIGKIKTAPRIEVSYEELSEYFKTGEYPPEIEDFRDNVFFKVLEVTEKKSWWDWGAFIVAMLGVAQIIAGVLLECATVGAATHFGMALIMEGAGDLAFAIQAGVSKSFNWKDYGIHKSISMAISIATAGIGAWLSRGTVSAAKFGFQLAKAVGAGVLKKCIEVTAFTLADIGIDKLLDKIQDELIKSGGESLKQKVDPLVNNLIPQLESAMNDVYEKSYEKDQAVNGIRDAFQQVLNDAKEGEIGIHVTKYGSMVATSLAGQFGKVSERITDHGKNAAKNLNLGGSTKGSYGALTAKALQKVIKCCVTGADIIKTICQMAEYAPHMVKRLITKLKVLAVQLKGKKKENAEKCSPEEFEQFKSDFTGSVKADIVKYLLSSVQNGLLRPAMQTLAHSALTKAGKGITDRMKNCGKVMNMDNNIKKISEYQQSKKNALSSGIKKKGKKWKVVSADIDPGTNLENAKDTSISDIKTIYGDSVNFYRDKRGKIYYEKPPFQHSMNQIGNGQTGKYFDLVIIANCYNTEIKIEDTTGQLRHNSKDGIVTIKPRKKLFRKNKTEPMNFVYMKTADGNLHIAPKINGKTINISQGLDTLNTCLYQSADLCQRIKNKSIPDDKLDSVIKELATAQNTKETIAKVRSLAKQNKTIRKLYQQGINEWAPTFSAGMPERKIFSNEEIANIKFSQSSVRRTTSDGMLIEDLMKNMQNCGWKGDPLEVVEMKPNQYTTLNNRRTAAAKAAGIKNVPVINYQPGETLPPPKSGNPYGKSRTAGDAVRYRMNKASKGDRTTNSDKTGFTSTRIRTECTASLEPFTAKGLTMSYGQKEPVRQSDDKPCFGKKRGY